MLDDDEFEALLYDWECSLTLDRQLNDVTFLRDQIAGKRVLELGCGTGRVAIPLAEQGLEVTGIDLAPGRIAVARRRAAERAVKVEWLVADMSSFCRPQAFDAVLATYSSFLLLPDGKERIDALRCVASSLALEGVAVIDTSPNFLGHPVYADRVVLEGPSDELDAGVALHESVAQDYVRQVTTVDREFIVTAQGTGSVRRLRTRERWHTLKPAEVRWLCAEAGLEVRLITGSYTDREPVGEDAASPKHIYTVVPSTP